ncbi:hypothetical protein SN1_003 [Sphaerotilus phage SN1]|nr:hypothetical protein SN1_003 [Sphaerotilus phage SN1]
MIGLLRFGVSEESIVTDPEEVKWSVLRGRHGLEEVAQGGAGVLRLALAQEGAAVAPGFSFELTPKVVMDLGSMTPLLRKMITL